MIKKTRFYILTGRQPLWGHNDSAFWVLITQLCLYNPELTLGHQFMFLSMF